MDGGRQSVSKSTVAAHSASHRSCVLTVVEKVPPTHPLLFQAGKRLVSITKGTDLESIRSSNGLHKVCKIYNGDLVEI